MDVYDLYQKIQQLWVDHVERDSGTLHKKKKHMVAVVNTDEGFREVIGVTWDDEIKAIRQIVDGD
jgi:hypothetical protein